MKIVIIGTAYPYRGGLAAYNERLASEFRSGGDDVSILTFSVQYPGFLFPGKTQYLDGPPPKGLKIERAINSVNPFSWLSVGSKLRREHPDIVIFKFWLPFMAPCFGTIARVARSNKHTKVICIFDNIIPHEKRPGDMMLTRYFMKAIDGGIAMSQSVLNDLAIFRKDIPSGLNPHPLFDNFGKAEGRDISLKKLGLDPAFTYLLFFGFVRAYKGLDLLIDAFSDIRFRNRKLKLIVAGEFYEDDKPYKNRVGELGLDDEVIFFDRFINDDEVKYFFGPSELIIQPYRDATQSGVTQIAYHFEKPMVVTDVGGLREIVPDGSCGYVVKPDPLSIADAIADFLDNGRKEIFTENVKQEKVKYSWSRMTASIKDIYEKIISYDHKK
jgi:glycosyltransferase involved in cell wall biosynthesis